MSTPSDLAATLTDVTEREYVRFVADWMTRAEQLEEVPPLTGAAVIDALVAAAASHVAFQRTGSVPSWTQEPARRLDSFWHPGSAALLANALVHAPLSFKLHGILIEADSLVSV
ncbi:hypothetical protein GB931_09375 [Modestobacter sp. I12A-02628]|uniref:Uncharacterized protein n=1 Tax=Goekera deserti TaxID=2497753 RepID=A0A7K3WJN2_9ACTN|nr:hypothetical protein [Goekera deserti]MPQ98127.1 hypothetical protein [Goekera deserti]NDI48775.1 hypothetical protein [Goekera deserti]NEL56701.1 hypothetical protein [Goekera deserti]